MSDGKRPGLLALASDLDDVAKAVERRNHHREALLQKINDGDEERLKMRLSELKNSLSHHHGPRREPFPPLPPEDLGVLEWAMRQALDSRRLAILEEKELSPEEQSALTIIRAHRVYERHKQEATAQLSTEIIREAIRTLAHTWLASLFSQVESHNIVVVMMLRAGLILGEGAYETDIRTFGSIDAWKIPTTLETHIGAVSLPKTISQAPLVILMDSAGATFTTIRAGLEILRRHGVDSNRVIIYTIDLAPEGFIPFSMDEPQVQVVSHSRSFHLDSRGLLVEIGIGNVDDQVMKDLDWDYGMEHWVERGLISTEMLSQVLERTRLIEQEARRRQRANESDTRVNPKTLQVRKPTPREGRRNST